MMLLAVTFVAVFGFMVVDQCHGLAFSFHGLRIQFHAPDGSHVAAAPVEVQPPVIVREEIGIPEVESAWDLLEDAAFRVFGAVEIADPALVAGTEVHPVPYDPHIRGVIVQGNACERALLPVHHVFAD